MFIKVEDLIAWKADRIAGGNCNYDDMIALGAFIDKAQMDDDAVEECIRNEVKS